MRNLANYNPLGINKVLENFFGNSITDFMGADFTMAQPSVNVVETHEHFRIEVAAPGLERGDFDIQVENDHLMIKAEKEHKDEVKEDNFVRREFNYASFSRNFQLPKSVDGEGIEAKYENGVLTIELPKKDEIKGTPVKRIEIR
ncbi:MAG: Hsp20/alpha crystallin family protein [Phaeodactylibacter sp.]|uniref:Hsp20/alpha crystallin family protein n=1 Tax=Phaeodactylibacter sp. TaxID=1940289 RepID=UPI0032EB1AD2